MCLKHSTLKFYLYRPEGFSISPANPVGDLVTGAEDQLEDLLENQAMIIF